MGYAGLCVHFSLTKPLILEWLSTPERLAGLSTASKLYLVIYNKFVYCTVYVYKQHLSNLPNLSQAISGAAFGARRALGHSPASATPQTLLLSLPVHASVNGI